MLLNSCTDMMLRIWELAKYRLVYSREKAKHTTPTSILISPHLTSNSSKQTRSACVSFPTETTISKQSNHCICWFPRFSLTPLTEELTSGSIEQINTQPFPPTPQTPTSQLAPSYSPGNVRSIQAQFSELLMYCEPLNHEFFFLHEFRLYGYIVTL